MEKNEELKALTAWPSKANDMTVDLMLRVIGCDTQIQYRQKWAEMDKSKEHLGSDHHQSQTLAVISGVGLMACIRALRDVDPSRAEIFVRDYWNMCEAGDSFGELLWDFAQDAGLDLTLVDSAPAVDAVGLSVGADTDGQRA